MSAIAEARAQKSMSCRPLTTGERQAKHRARISQQIASLKARLAWYEAKFGADFGPPPLVGLPPAPRGRHARAATAKSDADPGRTVR